MRKPIQNRSKPMPKLEFTLLQIWQMGQNYSGAIGAFELFELVDQPLELAGRVVESGNRIPVLKIANICIDRQNSCLFIKLLCKILVFQEWLLTLLVINKLQPFRGPFHESLIQIRHRKNVLWIGIVVSDSREYFTLVVREAFYDCFGYILHNFDIWIEWKSIEVMRNGITTPKYKIWLYIFPNFFE